MTNFRVRTEYDVNCNDRRITFAGFLIGPESPKKLGAYIKRLGLTPPTITELFYLAREGFKHLKKNPDDTNASWIKNAFSKGILSFTKVLATEEEIYAYDPTKHRREDMKEKRLIDSLEKKSKGVSYSKDKTIRYLSRKEFYIGWNRSITNDNRWELILGINSLMYGRTGIQRPNGEEGSLVREARISVPGQEHNYEILPCHAFVSLKITPNIFEINGRKFEGDNYTIGVIKRA